MILEICANSFASARAAQKAGADRIELCTELAVGGLTPSHGLIKKVMAELDIPVHVLIRPRSGDFCYSKEELDVMAIDIEYCYQMGCAGIVSGALVNGQDGKISIDKKATLHLIETARNMEFTFHRGFDWVDDPRKAIETLTALGVTRLLTSGQRAAAIDGIELLKELKAVADRFRESGKKPVQIMPGGGITLENILMFKNAGFVGVHFSATRKKQKLSKRPKVPFHSPSFFEEGIVATSDLDKITAIKKALSSRG